MRLQAVGQSTFVVTLADGAVLLLDPWFSHNPIAPRAIPLPFGLDAVGRIDAVLASHNHVDHVDQRSLRAARRHGAVVVGPPGVTRRARWSGVRDVRTLARGQSASVAGATVEAVFATHPLCVSPIGWLLTDADGTTLYHSGDTRYDDRIAGDVGGRRIDVACLQIAAAHYPRIGRDGMNIGDAARLADDLDARVAVPMHFHVKGKVADPQRFAEAAGSRACVLMPGEAVEVGKRP